MQILGVHILTNKTLLDKLGKARGQALRESNALVSNLLAINRGLPPKLWNLKKKKSS
jgi:hypothetical protein